MIKTAAKGDASPASIVTRVNDALSADNPTSMFVTLFIAIVDFRSGSFSYCNAGHNPPYIVHADGELTCLNQRHGVVMGAMEGLAYGEGEAGLNQGDALFMFTDGVTEAMDTEGQLYDEARLEQLLERADRSGAESLTGSVLRSVESFAQGAEQSDDITILAYCARQSSESVIREVLDLTIDADLAQIAEVLEKTQAFADRIELPVGVGQKMGMILDELLNNSISYGFEDPSGHEIDIHIHADASRLTLKVCDEGIPFNPFSLSRPDTSLGIEEREIGGLGVMLVKEMTDRQEYERLSGQNVITLTIDLNQNN
jgi:sigma-B regulation protein RsbU (phosphoserine phosphatase)